MIRSNGTVWCANAANARARTSATSARHVVAPGTGVRITSVLRKKPISGSSSGLGRCATGTPTATSDCPAWRASTACHAASITMKGVAPCARAQDSTSRLSAASHLSETAPPCTLCTGPRGRSVGSASGVTSASWVRQYASSVACRPAANARRCHAA